MGDGRRAHGRDGAASPGPTSTASPRRASAAPWPRRRAGPSTAEIVPVADPAARRARRSIAADEGPRAETTAEGLARLSPGVQAGRRRHGRQRLDAQRRRGDARGRVRGGGPASWAARRWPGSSRSAVSGIDPRDLFLAPIGAVRPALEKAGLTPRDIDLFEINEAFASQMLGCVRGLEIDPAKVNVHGGAIALGHPIGASGARVLVTLLHALERRGGAPGRGGPLPRRRERGGDDRRTALRTLPRAVIPSDPPLRGTISLRERPPSPPTRPLLCPPDPIDFILPILARRRQALLRSPATGERPPSPSSRRQCQADRTVLRRLSECADTRRVNRAVGDRAQPPRSTADCQSEPTGCRSSMPFAVVHRMLRRAGPDRNSSSARSSTISSTSAWPETCWRGVPSGSLSLRLAERSWHRLNTAPEASRPEARPGRARPSRLRRGQGDRQTPSWRAAGGRPRRTRAIRSVELLRQIADPDAVDRRATSSSRSTVRRRPGDPRHVMSLSSCSST